MPTLATCLKKHVTEPADRELVRASLAELKETMPASKASVRAVSEALSLVEDERDTFLGNLEKTHNVKLARPERFMEIADVRYVEPEDRRGAAPAGADLEAARGSEGVVAQERPPGIAPETVAVDAAREETGGPDREGVAAVGQRQEISPGRADAIDRTGASDVEGRLGERADVDEGRPGLGEEAQGIPAEGLPRGPDVDAQLPGGTIKGMPGQGMLVDDIVKIAQEVYEREGVTSPLRVVETTLDLPLEIQRELDKYGSQLNPRALQFGDVVYIIASNAKDREKVEQSIIHELIHVGNRRKFGAEFNTAMRELFENLGGEEKIRKIAARYGVESFIDQYRAHGASDATIANELMSFVGMMLDDKTITGRMRLALKEFLAKVRALLREYELMRTAELNDTDLILLIREALDAAQTPQNTVRPIMVMEYGVELEQQTRRDAMGNIAFQLEQEQNESNLYANQPSAEVDTVVQKIKDYMSGRKGEGIGSEVSEHYGFWDRWIGTLDNLAAKNPDSPVPRFFELAKRMRMDQDETFALTKVAVDAYNRLPGVQQAKLKRALLEGTLSRDKKGEGMGVQWGRDELKQRFGMNRDAMQSYEDIRAYFDEIKDRHRDRLLERVGVELVKEGEEEKIQMIGEEPDASPRQAKRIALGERIVKDFAELEGYFPLMRFGDFTIAVRDKDGELVHFEQAESKRSMNRIAGKMRRIYGEGFTVTRGRLEKFTGESMIGDPRLMSMLRDYVEEAGGIEGVDMVDDIEQEMLKRFAEQSFKKRMIHRKGIPGYQENIPRVIASYGWSASNYLSKLRFIPKLQKHYEDTDQRQYPQIREHMARQIEYMKGGAEGAAGEEFQWFKAMTFAMYMGLNVKSAAVNLTQVPMVLYPYLSSQYNDAKAIAAITKAQKAAAMPGNTGNDKLNWLMKWAEKEGLTMDAYLSDLMGMARGKRMAQARLESKAMSAISFMFSHAERFNRRVSAAAEFYANPNRSREELQAAMEKTIRTTQFDYGKHNRGRIFQGWTSMPMQFQQFTVNYLQFLHPKKHGWGTTLRAMGMLWLGAGLMGTPGADDARSFIEYMYQKAFGRHLDIELEARKAIVDLTREYMGTDGAKTIAETVLRGQGAYMAGTIAGSLSSSRLIPGWSEFFEVSAYRGLQEGAEAGIMQAAGAGPGLIVRSLRGMEEGMKSGDWRRFAERGPVPVAIQNLMKAVRTGTEGVDRDYAGRVQIAYEPTLVDTITQGLSFQPSAKSRLYGAKRTQMRESAFVKGEHSEMLTQLAIAYAERDLRKIREARADIARWNRIMPYKWRLDWKKVQRSIKARRKRFEITGKTGQEPILKQLRGPLKTQQARYLQL